jgi:hypothetical protein
VIEFRADKRMKPKKRPALKDEEALVRREKLASISKELNYALELLEDRLLGKDTSSSVKTVSGGRPESDRSKF